jgi:hypothetical protein
MYRGKQVDFPASQIAARMNNHIVQFVCFITGLEIVDFVPEWESFAGDMEHVKIATALLQKQPESPGKYRYISLHPCQQDDTQFSFIKQRISKYFHNHDVKVIHAGGYIPVQMKRTSKAAKGEVKLIVCLSHQDGDIEFYKSLPLYNDLNIYQAYYESCTYGFILEFFVGEKTVGELELKVKRRPDTERGIYKEMANLN